MKRYRGILFIDRNEISRLAGGGSGTLWDASLVHGRLRVVWSGGRQGNVELERVLQQADLDARLPRPSLAFVADADRGTVGLLFESSTPAPGLQYVEPHSVVFPLGWLSKSGVQPAP